VLRNLGVRGKILAVLAVPVLVLVVVAGGLTFVTARSAIGASNVDQLLEVVGAGVLLSEQLQAERQVSTTYLNEYERTSGVVSTAIEDTDAALSTAVSTAYASGNSASISAVDAVATAVGATIRPSDTSASVSLDDEAGALTESRSFASNGGDAVIPEWPTEQESAAVAESYAAMIAAVDNAIDDLRSGSPTLSSFRSALVAEASAVAEAIERPRDAFDSLQSSQNAVNEAATSYIQLTRALPGTPENAPLIANIDALEEQLQVVVSQREQTLALQGDPIRDSLPYGVAVAQIVNGVSLSSALIEERNISDSLRAYSSLTLLTEAVLAESVVAQRIIAQGGYQEGDLTAYQRLSVASDLDLATARQNVEPLGLDLQISDFSEITSGEGAELNFADVRNQLRNGAPDGIPVSVAQWTALVEAELGTVVPVRDELWRTATTGAEELLSDALTTTVFTVVTALVVLGISLALAISISRQITGPLLRLSTTASAVREELPRMVERVAEPGTSIDASDIQIPVETTDEIGDLARAFNEVNAATLSIAGEQAALRSSISEMFVNVARRDQVLLNRQLSSIDEMERQQDDAETLKKLFALDHLATRMRRNSESLLVLAGIDTGRRMRNPMPLSDVVRTASSEIELYERIQLDLGADPRMLGHSALTAAHMFAELLENATVFSDPGSPVVVRTSEGENSFVVEIVDQGIGMAPKELANANERIQSVAASDILGAQRLGLFVVGRIARRLGARVDIASAENQGTTARVLFPKNLFEGGDSTPEEGAEGAPLGVAPDSVNISGAPSGGDVPAVAAARAEAGAAPAVEADTSTQQTVVAARDALVSTPSSAPPAPVPDAPVPVLGESPTREATEVPASPSGSDDLAALIDADAAQAPVTEAVDLDALTEGTTAAGLPTRRRKPDSNASSDGEEPASFSTGPDTSQIAALGGAADTFSPPERTRTPDERASMFRGFRQAGTTAANDLSSLQGQDSAPQPVDQDQSDDSASGEEKE